jgi:hypothetical protein
MPQFPFFFSIALCILWNPQAKAVVSADKRIIITYLYNFRVQGELPVQDNGCIKPITDAWPSTIRDSFFCYVEVGQSCRISSWDADHRPLIAKGCFSENVDIQQWWWWDREETRTGEFWNSLQQEDSFGLMWERSPYSVTDIQYLLPPVKVDM